MAAIKTSRSLLNPTSSSAYRHLLAINRQEQPGCSKIWSHPQSTSTAREHLPPAPLPFSEMPGPRGIRDLPLIGQFLRLKPFTNFTLEDITGLLDNKHEEYGDIFSFRLRWATRRLVITSNADDVETILRLEGAFPNRNFPVNIDTTYRKRNDIPLGLLSESYIPWKSVRSPLNVHLNRPKSSLKYLPAQNEVADDFVKVLCDSQLTPEQVSDTFYQFAAESVGVICFNQRLGVLDPAHRLPSPKQHFIDASLDLMSSINKSMSGIEWKFHFTERNEFYQNYAKSIQTVRDTSTAYSDNVKEDVARNSDLENCLLANLLTKSDLGFKRGTDACQMLLFFGTDSSAKNLAIVLYNLAKHPDKQAKAAEEVKRVLGSDQQLTSDSLAKLPYMKACVKESMRVNFPVSSGPVRDLEEDAVLSGYLVPKGTSVLLNLNRVALSPLYYSDASSFIPERWLRSKKRQDNSTQPSSQCPMSDSSKSGDQVPQASKSPYTFGPFGYGVRSCVGRRFAEMEMHVGVAKVLQKLHVTVDPAYTLRAPLYTPFITPREPIPLVFIKREQ